MKKIMVTILSSMLLVLTSNNLHPRPMGKTSIPTSVSKQTSPTDKLAAANEKLKNARTPEEKAAAKKEVIRKAAEVLKFVTAKRNLMGELRGYQTEEKEEAEDILPELEAQQQILQKIVDNLNKKKDALEDKGYFWNSIKPGKENAQQYAKITEKLNDYQPHLDKLNAEIRELRIITGQQKFTKTRAFAIGSLITALGIVATYKILGPLVIKSEAEKFKNDPTGYMVERGAALKNLITNWGTSSATDATGNALLSVGTDTINLAGKTLDQESLALRFGSSVANRLWRTLERAGGMAVDMAISAGVSAAMGLALKELSKLLEDHKTTPEQIEAQNAKIQNIAAQESKAKQQLTKAVPAK